MPKPAVTVEGLAKSFRLYHEKNRFLKAALLRGRRARYEEFWALDDVSFEITEGSAHGIIGSNGSGKSTLLKCLTGILAPDRGSVRIHGNIAALLELGAGFHPELSGRENIFLNGAILGLSRRELDAKYDEIVEFSGLEKFIDTPVKNFSSGMTVRLGFAIAINVDPAILIIDEVLAVGDTAFQQKCREKIENFRERGKTIILVSHGLADVANVCDTAMWLDKGVLRRFGPAVDVVNDYNAESHGATPMAGNEIARRWGSGDIRVTDVHVADEQGRRIDVVDSGRPVRLVCGFDSTIELGNSCVTWEISDIHGTVLWSTNSRLHGMPLPVRRGSGSNTLSIPGLHLLEGTYLLSVAVANETNSHEYDHIQHAHRFEVRQQSVQETGVVRMDSRWESAAH
jgi:ABC-2 type transport system ATP-binding protein